MAYTKTCACGTPFETENYRQRKCTPHCGEVRNPASRNTARARERDQNALEFIGVDGEGMNVMEWTTDWDEDGDEITVRKRVHRYVMLSVGDQTLHKSGEELTYDEIFTFLWEQYLAHPEAAFVGFFLGYDFTHWLKSLPATAAKALFTKEGIARRKPPPGSDRFVAWPVRDGRWENGKLHGARWEFDILGNKRFKLRPYVAPEHVEKRIVTHRDGSQSEENVPRPWMYICDAGPFFQTSFLKAIDPKDWNGNPICTDEEFALIKKGKEQRNVATVDEEMIRYNTLENEVLARVMTRLNEGFVADNIRLGKAKWYGPGAAAQEWMKLIGAPTGEEVREVVPDWAREAGRKCFYGGWFEIFNHGPVPGTSYNYDINSAYPAEIERLPCLLHGTWSRGKGKPRKALPQGYYQMTLADLSGDDHWVGAAPHRNPDGSILRPNKTRGWHWQFEIDAAVRAGVINKVVVREWIRYAPCPCDPPFAAIRDLYDGRIRVGKNTPEGKTKKLLYNSSYGKMAQSIGQPRYSNPIYASLITAGCRTRILDAIATHPTKTKSLLMVATDGIVFKEPHPTLDVHDTRLGAWDEGTYENLSLFMPGLYWCDKARESIAAGKDPKLKSRGVRAKDLSTVIGRADQAWTRKVGPEWTPPVIEIAVEWAQITAKQAIHRGQWSTAGMAVWGEKRIINGNFATKRHGLVLSREEGWERLTPEERRWAKRDNWTVGYETWGGLRTSCYPAAMEDETTYYSGTFGEMLEERNEDEDAVGQMETQDGVIGDLQSWAIIRR